MGKGFKFCKLFNNAGAVCGLEATCYVSGHEGASACRRTRAFGKRRTEEVGERLLKHWCLQANDHRSRSDHVHKCPDPVLRDLPSKADLDSRPAHLDNGVLLLHG